MILLLPINSSPGNHTHYIARILNKKNHSTLKMIWIPKKNVELIQYEPLLLFSM